MYIMFFSQKFLDKTEKFMQTHVETAATEAEEVQP
jgi:hypothetical protein